MTEIHPEKFKIANLDHVGSCERMPEQVSTYTLDTGILAKTNKKIRLSGLLKRKFFAIAIMKKPTGSSMENGLDFEVRE